jgi:hypothetical protein
VSRREIDGMLELGLWFRFPDRTGGPARRKVTGYSERGRLVTLVIDVASLRPIACWPASPAERQAYDRRRRGYRQ